MKGSVLGRRFEYEAQRPIGAHYKSGEWEKFTLKQHDMTEWCHEHCSDHWGTQGYTFWFFLEEDYVMFMLRWA